MLKTQNKINKSILKGYFFYGNNLDEYKTVSILVKQVGNTFEEYELDGKKIYMTFDGKISNKEELTKSLDANVKSTIKGKSLFIIMILGIGIFFIVDSKKKKD